MSWAEEAFYTVGKQSLIREIVHMLLTPTSTVCRNANATAAHGLELSCEMRRFASDEEELILLSQFD